MSSLRRLLQDADPLRHEPPRLDAERERIRLSILQHVAVDHPTRRLLRELVEEIRASFAIPIILVSHDVEDALRLAHTVCFLQDGICQEIGPPQTLLRKRDGKLARWIGGSGERALYTRRCADQTMRGRNGMNSAWPIRTSAWHEALSGTSSGEFHDQHDRTGEA